MSIPSEFSDVPWRNPWAPDSSPGFAARLAKEVGSKHVLHKRPAVTVARRFDNDDVLFYLPAGPALLAVVHLTYSARTPEPDPRFPYTTLYASVREWIEQCLTPDAGVVQRDDRCLTRLACRKQRSLPTARAALRSGPHAPHATPE
ncbi:MAG: hypothetical protein ACRENH_07310 [Gemmatimonadaceae bacterium]